MLAHLKRWQISGMPVTRIFPHVTACLYCTWFGRVALVSAARRAKSATFASLPKTGSPSPLSITLNPDVKLSWWIRRNRLANTCMMSVLLNLVNICETCSTFNITDFFTLCLIFDFQNLTPTLLEIHLWKMHFVKHTFVKYTSWKYTGIVYSSVFSRSVFSKSVFTKYTFRKYTY